MQQRNIPIWDKQIPYNTGEEKKNLLKISKIPLPLAALRFALALSSDKMPKDTSAFDTFVYKQGICKGDGSRRMDDVPYLLPYPVSGSKQTVLIVPGGALVFKSMDGEGMGIAKELNHHGISAFVLWYRSIPYTYQVSLADVQRAMRFLRYHAKEWHLDPDNIGLMGFSAGGFLSAGHICLNRDARVGPLHDAIDQECDRPAFAAHIYPCINFYGNTGILSAAGNRDCKAENWDTLLQETDLVQRIRPGDAPQFLCWGTADSCVPPAGAEQYAEALRAKAIPCKTLPIPGAGHGFGDCSQKSTAKYHEWLNEFANWVKQQ